MNSSTGAKDVDAAHSHRKCLHPLMAGGNHPEPPQVRKRCAGVGTIPDVFEAEKYNLAGRKTFSL